MKWLVSAFEPFGGGSTNSSQIVVNALAARDWGGRVEFYPNVPVEFGRGWLELEKRAHGFDGVLAFGQAETRARVGYERVALNMIDARIADNAGVTPPLGPIVAGPDTRWCPIPWENLPLSPLSERSYSAGTFVCNELMYHLLGWAEAHGKLAGFVHLPAPATFEIEEEAARALAFCLSL